MSTFAVVPFCQRLLTPDLLPVCCFCCLADCCCCKSFMSAVLSLCILALHSPFIACLPPCHCHNLCLCVTPPSSHQQPLSPNVALLYCMMKYLLLSTALRFRYCSPPVNFSYYPAVAVLLYSLFAALPLLPVSILSAVVVSLHPDYL